MTALLWLLRGLCIYVTLQAVATIYFSDDEYQTRRFVTHDFFANDDGFIGQKRTDIFQANGGYSFGNQWCRYNAIKSGNTIRLTVQKLSCATASLKTVVNKIMGGLNEEDKIKTATQDFFDSQLFEVTEITADISSQLLRFKTKARSSFRLFAYLQVGKFTEDPTIVEFALRKTDRITLNRLEIKVNGYASLGTNKAKTVIEKQFGKDVFEIKELDIANGEINIFDDIAKTFTIDAASIARESDNFKHDKIESMTFTGVKGYGGFKVNDEFQIVLESKEKESLTEIAEFNNIKSYFFISRYLDDVNQLSNPFGAFFWKFQPNVNIHDAVDPLLSDNNLQDLPILRHFENRPWCMTISKNPGTLLPISSIRSALEFCFPDDTEKKISSGFNLKIHITLKKNLQDKKCGAALSQLTKVPEVAVIGVAITTRNIKFAFPEEYGMPVKATIKCMGGSDFSDVPLKLFNQNKDDDSEPIFQIQDFAMNPTIASLRVTFSLTLPSRYRTIDGTGISIGALKLTIEKTDDGWEITGLTTVTLNNIYVDLSLTKTTGGGGWKFTIKIPSITMQEVIDLFKNNQAGTHADLIPATKQFGVKDAQLEWQLDDKGVTEFLRVKGNPIIFGYDGALFEAIWWRPKNVGEISVDNEKTGERIIANQPENAFAFAVWFKTINFDWFIKKLMGSESMSVPFFNNMDGLFIVSNALGKVEKEEEEDSDPYIKTDEKNSDDDKKPKDSKSKPVVSNRNGLPARRLGKTPAKEHAKTRRRVKNYRHRRAVQHRAAGSDVKSDDSGKKDIEEEDEVEFTLSGLSGEVIRPGVSIMLQWKMPALTTACFNNDLCKWMVENIGSGAFIKISGYFGSKKDIEITAQFGSVNIWVVRQVLKFEEILLKLKIGSDPSLRLEMTVMYFNNDISKNGLKFSGSIEIGFTGTLSLEATLSGIVEHPWKLKGNKYFSFGNLLLSTGVSVGAVPFPSIQAGAKIILGVTASCDSTTVCIEGYFGFDPNRPQDFWIYAKANALTIKRLCEAFQFKCNLPEPIKNIGFPEGFEFSYSDPSGEGKSISSIGLNVPAGFFLSGKLVLFDDGKNKDNTLAFWGKIKVEAESFEVDVKMTPINWVNGFIRIQRTEDDSENGPSFYLKADLPDHLRANISGYANIFGIKAAVTILIQDSFFHFQVMGPLIPGILDVEMTLKATYSGFKDLSFYMKATVMTSTFAEKIANAMKTFIEKYWAQAHAKIEDAKIKVDAAKQKVNDAKEPVKAWQERIRNWKNGLNKRLVELERKKASLQSSCKSKCGKVCVGFFNWEKQCWKIFGYWVGCLVWDSCFGKIDDIICLAKCEITKIANKFVIWLEQVSIKIQSAVGSIAVSLGDMAIGVLNAAEKVVSFGNDILSFTQTALKSIGDAATWIASNLNNICELRELSLFAQMTNTFDACVGYKIDLTIFGITIDSNGQACINLEFLNNLVYGIAASKEMNTKYPKLADTKTNIELLEGKVEAMNDQEKNFEKEKKTGESEMNKELAKKYDEEARRRRDGIPHSPDILEWAKTYLPKKSVLPAEWQTKIDEASTMPIPEYDVRNEFITNAFMQKAPWKLYESLDVQGLSEKPIRDATVTGSIRSLDFDSKMTACERVKRAIIGYKDLANGLIETSKSFEEREAGYLAYRRSLYQQKEDIYKQITDMEHRHNLTDADREDAYHWYNTLEDGINEMSKRSEIVMNRQDKLTIPIVRRQLDFILKKEKGSTLKDFVGVIHENAMKGYKRSSIPTAHDVDGEGKLKEINKELVSIINNDDDSLTQMSGRLTSLRSNIHTMSTAMKNCRDH